MSRLYSVYIKIDDILEKIIKCFCALLLAGMIFICFANTMSRYFLLFSFKWSDEVIRYAAVWVTCIGASLTARADEHITMDLIQEMVKNNKAKAVLYAFTRLLACVILMVLLPAAFEMVRIYASAFSTACHMPQWILYISYPIGNIAIFLGYLRVVPPKTVALWKGTVEKSEFEKINEGEIE